MVPLEITLRNEKKPKTTKSSSYAFIQNVFTTTSFFFSHVYQLHVVIYGLKCILKVKNLEIV
jgi:hypothetical protein